MAKFRALWKVRQAMTNAQHLQQLIARFFHVTDPKPDKYCSVDSQFERFIYHNVVGYVHVTSTKYRGYAETAVFGLLYLISRNKNECVVLSNFDAMHKRLMQNKTLNMDNIPFIDWSYVGFVYGWDENGQKLCLFPGKTRARYVAAMHKCLLHPKTRFTINIVTLCNKQGEHHANILLYDRFTHTAERFDPYEIQLPGMELDDFDRKLREVLLEVDPLLKAFYAPKNPSLFSDLGFQGMQEMEGELTKLDPVGFCQPLTFLIADTRMSFPDQDTKSITAIYRKAATENNISLTTFIRNYTDHLFQTAQSIFRRYTKSKQKFIDFEDQRVALLAVMMRELSIHKTVFA